ncbi:3-isopropylmalate dehydrogenase [Candidatus Epulonipiscium fishelsonii]|uniref:3-isopropylmalate dehydrogenase n=1 Tax=Candidatus Epulonipiscium fishelsonii TaxID=77094 RepID=A0ACC8XEW1_9FIRM|nr:3-isopropylmalate dehydrogenase [Epulopiscium sp. SCG-B05WGA-EpuloA1]ONI41800.1 3-isopropylmalate dehydrogenase [Epulopiscium sp. SCG-B11WGA-EpuloA1]
MKIVTLSGDGIGPEIIQQAINVLRKIGEMYGHIFEFEEYLIGDIALEKINCSLPEETIVACKNSDAVLLGAVGGAVGVNRWINHPTGDRPEKGLLKIRQELGLYCNLRPAILYPQLKNASPIRQDIIGDGLDIMIVRELTSGIYFGKKLRTNGETDETTFAIDELYYNKKEIKRILEAGFNIAMKRSKNVVVVDKANVLETSKLWREVTQEVAKNFPEVKYSHMYVDNAAMQLVSNPKQFDVIITTNMFGDILSDEASVITGSIGMLPSASLGNGTLGLYEPSHGSAPDIAGKDKANPLATILSAAMMLRYSLNLEKEAQKIENAVIEVLELGYRTEDIFEKDKILVGTRKMGELVIGALNL